MQYKNPAFRSPKPRTSVRKRLGFTLLALLLIALVVTALELTNVTHFFHSTPVKQVTGGPATKGQPINADGGEASDANSDDTGTTDDNSDDTSNETPKDKRDANTSAKLTAPEGPFVSNHRPNLDGSPAPNTINSVCNTVSGATCQIVFSKDGVTKSLPAQRTDRGGAAYWNGWKIQNVGLTTGEWKITAKAILGGQSKTAADALPLKVAP